jgi:hypothetical protein
LGKRDATAVVAASSNEDVVMATPTCRLNAGADEVIAPAVADT